MVSPRPQSLQRPPLAACAGAAVVGLLLAATAASAQDVFCKADSCFEILGLKPDASLTQIRRAYRRLAPALHPDVNPGNAKAAETFKSIANAYEVLTDPTRRRAYNDYLAHPEKFAYMMEFARTSYAPQSSVWVVMLGLLLAATTFHWFNMRHNFYSAVERVRESEEYQREVRRMIARKEVATVEEAHEAIHVDFGDVRLPTPRDLLPLKLAMLPLAIGKFLYWAGHWLVAYKLLKQDYTEEDKEYLVRQNLGLSPAAWEQLEPKQREEYMTKRLWIESEYAAFMQRKRIELNRSGKGPKRRKRVPARENILAEDSM
ncbi:hypothetical protein MMPV_000589 [Pyropia vietnamensis]